MTPTPLRSWPEMRAAADRARAELEAEAAAPVVVVVDGKLTAPKREEPLSRARASTRAWQRAR